MICLGFKKSLNINKINCTIYTQAIIMSFKPTNTYHYDFERTFLDCPAGRDT